MADNTPITPGAGIQIASDDIGGVQHQRVKMTMGADGVSEGDVSSTNPMPTKIVEAVMRLQATSMIKTANYTEPTDALSIQVISDVGSCSLPGGRVLVAGEAMSFSSPIGYRLASFSVTFISGQYTINVVR